MLALQYPRLNIFSEILSRISLIRKLTNKKLICLIRAGSLVQLVQVLGNWAESGTKSIKHGHVKHWDHVLFRSLGKTQLSQFFFGCYGSIHWQHMSSRTLRNGVLPRDWPTPGICLWHCLYNASASFFLWCFAIVSQSISAYVTCLHERACANAYARLLPIENHLRSHIGVPFSYRLIPSFQEKNRSSAVLLVFGCLWAKRNFAKK